VENRKYCYQKMRKIKEERERWRERAKDKNGKRRTK
jgi:hypothetical protein